MFKLTNLLFERINPVKDSRKQKNKLSLRVVSVVRKTREVNKQLSN